MVSRACFGALVSSLAWHVRVYRLLRCSAAGGLLRPIPRVSGIMHWLGLFGLVRELTAGGRCVFVWFCVV